MDADSVSRQGRSAQGVRVMNLRAGDSVSAIAKVVASRGASEDVADELTLEEIAGGVDGADGIDATTTNGEVLLG
jgi:DNA gyrase subunit A